MVQAQGGDVAQVDDPDLLPRAEFVEPIKMPRRGTIAAMDTAAIGWACVHLGGGRLVKSDQIDHAVGINLPAKVGDQFEEEAVIGAIHANKREKLEQAHEEILGAITISDEAVERLPHFYGVVE
jgi:pyrimidine-nucleoside phosphorylase